MTVLRGVGFSGPGCNRVLGSRDPSSGVLPADIAVGIPCMTCRTNFLRRRYLDGGDDQVLTQLGVSLVVGLLDFTLLAFPTACVASRFALCCLTF